MENNTTCHPQNRPNTNKNTKHSDSMAPVAPAPNVLPVPMKLLNVVAWVVFLLSAYHLWPSTESDRDHIHTPSRFHVRGLSVVDLSVILAFLASLLYLFGFFGIPFLQPDLPVQPPNEVSPECIGGMEDHDKFIAPAVVLSGNENDEDIVEAVLNGEIPSHALEKHLGNSKRAASIRREALQRTTGRTLKGLPLTGFDYDAILGRCCELPVGYVPLPVGIAGPLILDGAEYHVPMATTEGCLVASTNRGCKAVAESGGAVSTVLRDGMTRAPVVRFGTAARAARLKGFLEDHENLESVALIFNRSSRYARLQGIKCGLAGRYLYMRFVCSTGDAMGMNMVSKGVQYVLDFLQVDFPDMEVISISGNYCTDKKPAALNWIEGRGKSVVCEATIKGDVVKKVLKTDVASLVELNVVKNLVGSAVAGSVGGFNAHASNIVTAIFIATGQDPAQNVESSHCITMMEPVNGDRDLHVSVTMPCIEVGTVGGGTHLAAQAACLGLLGVNGASVESPGENARRLATIVAGAVLAGELSLMSALAAGQLVKSHMKYNRSTKEITGKNT